jgi:hypothetical protein
MPTIAYSAQAQMAVKVGHIEDHVQELENRNLNQNGN